MSATMSAFDIEQRPSDESMKEGKPTTEEEIGARKAVILHLQKMGFSSREREEIAALYMKHHSIMSAPPLPSPPQPTDCVAPMSNTTPAEADIIATVVPTSDEAISSLSESSAYDKSMRRVLLRFSEGPRDPTLGFCFGRDSTRCDVPFNAGGISKLHFRIDVNWSTGYLVLSDQSSTGTRVFSNVSGTTRLRQRQSVPLFTGDTIQAGLVRFSIQIPTHARCREIYDENLQEYRQLAKASIPRLDGLRMQDDTLATMQQPGSLTLLHGEEAIEQAIDCSGNVYAVKVWTRPREDYENIRSVANCPYLVSIFTNKVVNLEPSRYLVMEWLDVETLDQLQLLSPNEVATIVGQILQAVTHMHQQEIVHRRIRPSNILILSRKPITCKVGGFASSAKGKYTAPEVVARRKVLPGDYQSDVWSLGIIILELSLFGSWTLRLSKWSAMDCFAAQVSRPGAAWKTLTDFGNKMLSPNPQNRPTVAECSEYVSLLELEPPSRSPIETNIHFLSNQDKQIPGVSKELCQLLPTMSMSLHSHKAVIPYDRLSEIMLPEIAEIDVLLRGQVYQEDGQKYIIFEDVVNTLLSTTTKISMTTVTSSQHFLDHINHAHFGKVARSTEGIDWIF